MTAPGVTWLAIVGAAAVAAAILGAARHAVRFGVFAALLAAFQAAVLLMTSAGPVVRYQHLAIPPGPGAPRAALTVACTCAVLTLVAVWRVRHAIISWLMARLRPGAVVALLAALIVLAAVPTRPLGVYARELVAGASLQLVGLVLAGLAAAAAPDPLVARLSTILDGGSGHRRGRPDRLAWILAGTVTALAALLAVASYQRHPHIPDEVSYLLQARYFAHGMLTMPVPPAVAVFDLDLMTFEPSRWYSPFPPGWPAVLAVGVWAGVPWLVNPLLGGIAVLLAAALFDEMLERRPARLATILFALAPWQLFLAMSFMSHTLSLVLTLLAAVGLARLRRGAGAAWGWVAGAAVGVVSLMRPLEGIAVAAILGGLALAVRGRRFRLGPAATLAAGAALAGVAGLWYNRAITGHALTFPVMDYFDRYYAPGVNALGFGPDRGLPWGLDPFPGHGLRDVIANGAINAAAINIELFGWCVGSLLIVLLGVLTGSRERSTRIWVAAIAAIVIAHSVYWFSGGPDFGARYWFLVIIPCAALAARGLQALDTPTAPPRATLGALLLSAAALTVFVPWRATDKYFHYRGMRPDVRVLARTEGFGRGLVLVRGRRFPDYASAAAYNPPDSEADAPLYVWDRDAAVRRAVVEAFPDRPVWVVEGPSLTGSGYRVIGGPLTGAERAALLATP